MGAKQWMLQDMIHTIIAQRETENFAALRGDLIDVRPLTVALLDVGILEACNGRERMSLRVAGEAPCADRRCYQVHGSLKLRHDIRQNGAVELAQDQPLRAAGCTCDCADSFNRETVLLNRIERTGAGLEDEVLDGTTRRDVA